MDIGPRSAKLFWSKNFMRTSVMIWRTTMYTHTSLMPILTFTNPLFRNYKTPSFFMCPFFKACSDIRFSRKIKLVSHAMGTFLYGLDNNELRWEDYHHIIACNGSSLNSQIGGLNIKGYIKVYIYRQLYRFVYETLRIYFHFSEIVENTCLVQ